MTRIPITVSPIVHRPSVTVITLSRFSMQSTQSADQKANIRAHWLDYADDKYEVSLQKYKRICYYCQEDMINNNSNFFCSVVTVTFEDNKFQHISCFQSKFIDDVKAVLHVLLLFLPLPCVLGAIRPTGQ